MYQVIDQDTEEIAQELETYRLARAYLASPLIRNSNLTIRYRMTESNLRGAARRRLGAPNNVRVQFVAGSSRPCLCGEPGCYRTPGGTVIRHPSAYRKAGGWNQIYVPSTQHVVVGEEWRP